MNLSPSLPIEFLRLSNRPYQALVRAKIDTIGQLCALTEDELFGVPGIHKRSVAEIKAVLLRSYFYLKRPTAAAKYLSDRFTSVQRPALTASR